MNFNSFKNYIFYFPCYDVGGVSILFIRYAEYLAKTTKIDIYIIDYPNGYMSKNINKSLVNFIPYSSIHKMILPSNSLIILQSDLPWGIPLNFLCDDSTNVFFWNCYPFNLIPVFPSIISDFTNRSLFFTKLVLNTLLLTAKKKSVSFLNLLLANNSISFMDGPNYDTTKFCLSTNIDRKKFLPVSIHSSSSILQNKNKWDLDFLNFCWVGRLADFKISILNKVLKDTEQYCKDFRKKINFYIVGSGKMNHRLYKTTASEYLKIIQINYMSPSELDIFLRDIHCIFAMGTSALEGAKLAIPTILLDFSYGKIPSNYNYQFIYSAQNFSLGEPIRSRYNKEGLKLEELISMLNNQTGQRCFEYFLHNHSLTKNIDDFIEQTKNSTLSYNHLIKQNFVKKPKFYIFWQFIKSIFSNYI